MNNENITNPDYKVIHPFKGWVIENFPFIEADFDAITNYQLISKVVEYLNQVIANENLTEQQIRDLTTAYNNLESYVNNYFENLDVQEEINTKLDKMAESGELTNLIKNYVDPIQAEFEEEVNQTLETQNDNIANQNSRISALSSRMDSFTNLSEGSTTGDAELIDGRTDYQGITYANIGGSIRHEGSQLHDIMYNDKIGYTISKENFLQGSLGNNGKYNSSTTRIYSAIFFKCESDITFTVPNGTKLAVYWYDSADEDDFVRSRVWHTGTTTLTKEHDYFRVCCALSDDSTITPSDYTTALEFTMTSSSQINKNKTDIAYLSPKVEYNSKAVCNLYSLLSNKSHYYSSASGVVGTSATTDASPLIQVKTGEVIKYNLLGSNSSAGCVCLFDATKTFVSCIAQGVNTSTRVKGSYTFLADGYIGICNRADDYANGYFYFTNTIPDVISNELNTSKVPSYWESTLESKIATINENNNDIGANGVSFIYVTDIHWDNNAKNSPKLINEIIDKTNANIIFCGGDILDLHSTKTIASDIINDFNNQFSKNARLFTSLGNHDWNDNNASTYPDAHLDSGDVYNLFVRRDEVYVNSNKQLYYYLDNESQKVRYIVLNDGKLPDTTQLNWLVSTLEELDSTWTVVIFMHRYYVPEKSGTDLLQVDTYASLIINKIVSIESDLNCTIACIIAGHCHRDYNTTDNGYLIIGTNTDCYQESTYWGGETMTKDSNTEQCIDVFSIDTSNKTIKATRIGCGNNRNFSY